MKKFTFLLLLASLGVCAGNLINNQEAFLEIKKGNPDAYEALYSRAKKQPDSLLLIGKKEVFVEMKNFFVAKTEVESKLYKYDSQLDGLVVVKQRYVSEKKTIIVLIIALSLCMTMLTDALFEDERKLAKISSLLALAANTLAVILALILTSAWLTLIYSALLLISLKLFFALVPDQAEKKRWYIFTAYYVLVTAGLVVLL